MVVYSKLLKNKSYFMIVVCSIFGLVEGTGPQRGTAETLPLPPLAKHLDSVSLVGGSASGGEADLLNSPSLRENQN